MLELLAFPISRPRIFMVLMPIFWILLRTFSPTAGWWVAAVLTALCALVMAANNDAKGLGAGMLAMVLMIWGFAGIVGLIMFFIMGLFGI